MFGSNRCKFHLNLKCYVAPTDIEFIVAAASMYWLGSQVVIRMRCCTRLMSVWIHPYFDLETGIVIKGEPLGTEEGVGCGEVLVSFKSPVSSAEQMAHLVHVID